MPRKTNSPTTISLWSVIESMQRKLEREGLDTEVVDAAVTRGLESLLRHRSPGERRERQPLFSLRLLEA